MKPHCPQAVGFPAYNPTNSNQPIKTADFLLTPLNIYCAPIRRYVCQAY